MGLYMGTGGMDDLKWVAFSMSNASIHGDRGVSSITRHSSGRHQIVFDGNMACLLYTSPSPRDKRQSRMPSSA